MQALIEAADRLVGLYSPADLIRGALRFLLLVLLLASVRVRVLCVVCSCVVVPVMSTVSALAFIFWLCRLLLLSAGLSFFG